MSVQVKNNSPPAAALTPVCSSGLGGAHEQVLHLHKWIGITELAVDFCFQEHRALPYCPLSCEVEKYYRNSHREPLFQKINV